MFVLGVAVNACVTPASVQPSMDTVPSSSLADASDSRTERPDRFSGALAWSFLRHWLNLPRVLGDERRKASIAELAAALSDLGATDVQRFDHVVSDPWAAPEQATSYELTELVAHFRPEASRRFILATHFDTRPWADEDPAPSAHRLPIPGANDGTSGLAVVLAAIPSLGVALAPTVGFTIILFDGEELGHPGRPGYCAGSRWLAEGIEAGRHPLLQQAEFGIVLDMVGDRDLHVSPERLSIQHNGPLVTRIWTTAAQLGLREFDPAPLESGILDDHHFLSAAGIPSVLIIDRDYDAWHRRGDNLEQVSENSLDIVGEVVVAAILDHFGALSQEGSADWPLHKSTQSPGAQADAPAPLGDRPALRPPGANDVAPGD